MNRFSFVFICALLFGGLWNDASAIDASKQSVLPTLAGNWNGWWRPQNVMKQGNLSLILNVAGKSVSGTMKMHEYITGDIPLSDTTVDSMGQYVFVAQRVHGKDMKVTLQFLDDGTTLYGTAHVGGATIYLRLFKETK